jgi:uncharacterized protein (DUF1800 family)
MPERLSAHLPFIGSGKGEIMIRSSSLALLVLLGGAIASSGAATLRVRVDNAALTPAGVAFGTAATGQAVAKTFTVTNGGRAPVTLPDFISVPRGFTVLEDFATTQLAPGQSARFVAALNSSVAGRLSGNISFAVGTETVTIPVSGVAFGPPALRIVRSSNPGFQTTGQWVNQVASSGSGANTATWTIPGLTPGQYQVAATWTAAGDRASNAAYTVFNDKVPFTAVPVNQKRAPGDFRDAGTRWKVLGNAYWITSGTLSVQLNDQADGAVQADAIRIQRVGFPGRVVDIRDPGASTTGSWSLAPDSRQATAPPQGGPQATWTVTGLVPGQYRISASWQPIAKSASNVNYTILDGDRALTTVVVNQRQMPGDLQDAGTTWQDLGGLGSLYYVRGNKLVVRLNGTGANGWVAVGPIRLERIYNPGGSPPPGGGPDGTSYADAVRLLEQATWGPTDALIDLVMNEGIAGFLNDQLYNTPVSSYPTLTLYPGSQNTGCPNPNTRTQCLRDNYSPYPNQTRFYVNALYGPDQLIQRVSWAWHKIMVTSAVDNALRQGSHMAPYLQIFDQNGTGLYHDLLYNITLNAAMGEYLNMQGSTKANPNENYAREVLQLFSIGLNKLNPNGTLKLDTDGNPIPTYDQTTIDNFAKIFTGWVLAPPPRTGVPNYVSPMVPRTPEATYHDRTAKTLLRGVNVGANRSTTADLVSAINNITNDPNVGPFIGKAFIQQLVTSNPTPAYVARITAVFNNDGNGARGNMAAVVYAILTDPDARGDVKGPPDYPNYGKLREPVQYVNNILRAFNALSFDQTTQSDGYLNPQSVNMGQDVFRPVSVFSYFSPFKTLPDTAILAPEFQILDTGTALKRYNFVNTMTQPNGAVGHDGIAVSTNAPQGTKLDFSMAVSLANDPNALLDYLNGVMLHGTMTDDNRNAILPAITAVPASNLLRRAKVAVYLVATSSQYQVQR